MLKKIFIISAITIAIVAFWKTFIAYDVYFPILTHNEAHVVSVFEPNDLETYKSLIPKEFEMPAEPKVKVDFVEVNPYWHESYVSIRVNYKGELTWHALTWSIDTYVPYALGRWAGYPKFMADSFTYKLGKDSASSIVIKDSKLFLAMNFKKTNEPKTDYTPTVWENSEVYHLLAPPLEGTQINKLTFIRIGFLYSKELNERFGEVTMQFDEKQPWAKIIGEHGQRIAKGFYFSKDKTELFLLRAKQVN